MTLPTINNVIPPAPTCKEFPIEKMKIVLKMIVGFLPYESDINGAVKAPKKVPNDKNDTKMDICWAVNES